MLHLDTFAFATVDLTNTYLTGKPVLIKTTLAGDAINYPQVKLACRQNQVDGLQVEPLGGSVVGDQLSASFRFTAIGEYCLEIQVFGHVYSSTCS